MEKIPVYFVPGLAAKSTIFEFIILPDDEFESIFLEWEIPQVDETLSEYAKRLCGKILHENPVLIGVSFGGLVVQEMVKFISVRRLPHYHFISKICSRISPEISSC